MPKKNKTKANSFKKAVENTPDIAKCYQSGLQALGSYSKKIELKDTSLCSGSIDIDACTRTHYPEDNRWDYALCYNSKVYFVEVHSANTGEVSTVFKKLIWLKDWLNHKAPEINKLKAPEPFYWVQSGKYKIEVRSSQARRIATMGLKPIPKLVL